MIMTNNSTKNNSRTNHFVMTNRRVAKN